MTSQQRSIKNVFCRVNGLMDENYLAAIVPLSFVWHEYQKPCFFWEKLCDMFLTSHDKEFVVSTQTSAFLEVACITPHPQLYPEYKKKHDFLDKGEHNYRKKRFLNEI